MGSILSNHSALHRIDEVGLLSSIECVLAVLSVCLLAWIWWFCLFFFHPKFNYRDIIPNGITYYGSEPRAIVNSIS